MFGSDTAIDSMKLQL